MPVLRSCYMHYRGDCTCTCFDHTTCMYQITAHASTMITVYACNTNKEHGYIMIMVHACTIPYMRILCHGTALYCEHSKCIMIIVIIVHACTMIVVHACTMILVRPCTMIRVHWHACTMIIVHACTFLMPYSAHVFSPLRLGGPPRAAGLETSWTRNQQRQIWFSFGNNKW